MRKCHAHWHIGIFDKSCCMNAIIRGNINHLKRKQLSFRRSNYRSTNPKMFCKMLRVGKVFAGINVFFPVFCGGGMCVNGVMLKGVKNRKQRNYQYTSKNATKQLNKLKEEERRYLASQTTTLIPKPHRKPLIDQLLSPVRIKANEKKIEKSQNELPTTRHRLANLPHSATGPHHRFPPFLPHLGSTTPSHAIGIPRIPEDFGLLISTS